MPLALHMNLYANDAEINILEKQQEVHLVEGKNTSWQWRRKMIINNKAERNYVNIPRATFQAWEHLKIMKFPDLVYLYTALFMHDYYTKNLPISFNSYFVQVNLKHSYNTRLAAKSSYSLPQIRTNYGKFNIKYSGVKIWNSMDEFY